MTQALGVSEGSLAVLHPTEAGMEVEILPPVPREIKDAARRIVAKHNDVLMQIKRLDD